MNNKPKCPHCNIELLTLCDSTLSKKQIYSLPLLDDDGKVVPNGSLLVSVLTCDKCDYVELTKNIL